MSEKKDLPKLFLSMILGDFESPKIVQRSIDSVKEYVDGIYITVTYKKKKPKANSSLIKLLKKEGVIISYFKWVYDFSAARQYSLQQVPKGPQNYIYWHDADDILQDADQLRPIFLEAAEQNLSAVYFDYWYQVLLDEKTNTIKEVLVTHKRERIIRHDDTWKWIGALHETLIEQKQENLVRISRPECKVVHLTRNKRVDDNLNRNIEILENSIKKEKGKDPRTAIYLAKAYFDKAKRPENKERKLNLDLSLTLFHRYLEGDGELGTDSYQVPSGWKEERSTAWNYIGEIAIIMERPDMAVQAFQSAMDEAPWFPNYYINLAMAYTMMRDFKKAKHWLNVATTVPIPTTTIVVFPTELKTRALEVSYQLNLNEQKLDLAVEDVQKLLEIYPDRKELQVRLKFTENLLSFTQACKSAMFLGKYLEVNGDKDKLAHLVQSMTDDMQRERFAAEMRHRFMPKRLWAQDEISILCGPGFEEWSPKSIEHGLGGSESAIVYLSRELTKLGWRVTVFANPGKDAGNHDGVEYRPWYEINPRDSFNGLILWRNIGFVDVKPKAQFTMVWLHDVPNNPDFTEERVDAVDKIIVLSEYHKSLLMMQKDGEFVPMPENKVFLSANGITDLKVPKVKRNPQRMIYASSPDRGLIYLLLNWQAILKEVPKATLHIYYGFEIFDVIHKGNPAQMQWKNRIVELMKQPGITYHGRVGHDALHKAYAQSGVWVYPASFTEIFCQPAGSFVQTLQGDKPIESLNLQDQVMTHTGAIQNINALRKRKYQGRLLTIVPQCGEEFTVTTEHPILTISLSKTDQGETYAHNITKPKRWINAQELKKGDLVMIPRLKKTKGSIYLDLKPFEGYRENNLPTTKNPLPDKMEINQKMAWFLGYFAGDGNANARGKVSCLVADAHMERDYQKVLDGLSQFNIPIKENKLSGCLEIHISSYQLARVFRELFYLNKDKMIPRWLYSRYPDEVFAGLMAADGYYCQKGINGIQGSFTNKSRLLIATMRDLLSYKALAGKTHKRIHWNTSHSISYSLSWTEYSDGQMQRFYLEDDDYIYLKIRKIESQDFDGPVYNLDVENDNSYLTGGIAVHNCISAAKAQALGAIPVTTTLAALDETVKNGIKLDADITIKENQEEYVQALVKVLKDPAEQEKLRIPMMKWAKDYYQWEHVARSWDTLMKLHIHKKD